jgi:hypothetical protein
MPEAGITDQSFYPWKRKYMDMGVAELFIKQFSGMGRFDVPAAEIGAVVLQELDLVFRKNESGSPRCFL